VERGLAAILAADGVGYTRLMEADEAGTLQRLNKLRQGLLEPLINEHRGRIFKLIGDGLLVEFASVVDRRKRRNISIVICSCVHSILWPSAQSTEILRMPGAGWKVCERQDCPCDIRLQLPAPEVCSFRHHSSSPTYSLAAIIL